MQKTLLDIQKEMRALKVVSTYIESQIVVEFSAVSDLLAHFAARVHFVYLF